MADSKPSMSDEAVERATGRNWNDWFSLLDGMGAKELAHPEIARHLKTNEGLGGWWAQSVTVEYERSRGLRAKYQKSDGFAVSVSKTVSAGIGLLFEAWATADSRRRWLKADDYEITKATKDKTVRIAWDGGASRVDVYFIARDPSKSQVSVQHSKLTGPDQVEEMRSFWRDALTRMSDALE